MKYVVLIGLLMSQLCFAKVKGIGTCEGKDVVHFQTTTDTMHVKGDATMKAGKVTSITAKSANLQQVFPEQPGSPSYPGQYEKINMKKTNIDFSVGVDDKGNITFIIATKNGKKILYNSPKDKSNPEVSEIYTFVEEIVKSMLPAAQCCQDDSGKECNVEFSDKGSSWKKSSSGAK